MHSEINTPIIVIGGTHHNTLGVIRALGQQGLKHNIYLILKGDNNSFVSKSKYLLKQNITLIDDTSEIIPHINKILKIINYKIKPVVIACGDVYIAELDRNYNILKDIVYVPNASQSQGNINKLLDKAEQARIASEVGLLTPAYKVMTVGELDTISSFPCIIKPIDSTRGSKNDIEICKTKEDCEKYKKTQINQDYIRVEKYIEKILEFQLIGCALPQDIIIPGYTNIIRQPQNTNTGYLLYSPINDGVVSPDLISKVKEFIRYIGYNGLFSVEFIRDHHKKDYFLEINMRNDGNAYCVTSTGINLPYLWVKYYPNPPKKISETLNFHKPIHWMPEADIKNINKVGKIKWIIQWISSDSHGIANLKDPYPFIKYLFSKIFR